MIFTNPVGATPLDPDEANGLIPQHITTHDQLNEWEANNILKAEEWLFSTSNRNFLTIDYIKLLHKNMFDNTWTWAGTFRNSVKNIGVDPYKISMDLTNLLNDVIFQIQKNTYSIDELAYRFHHRLVLIHPFPNGNGRHARMMTDFLLTQTGHLKFTWGSKNLLNAGPIREQYIRALRLADHHDYTALAAFVRS